jgi:tetratricopeptide (TPR) repeat protein
LWDDGVSAPPPAGPILEQAEALFRDAVAIDGQNAGALFGLGTVLGDQNRYDDAYPYLKSAYETEHNADTAFAFGSVCARLDKLDESLSSLQQAHTLAPERTDIAVALAGLYEKMHDLDAALAMARRINDREPHSLPCLELIARIMRRQNNPADGLTYVSASPVTRTNDPVTEALYFAERARCLEDMGTYDDAFLAYQEAQRAWGKGFPDLDTAKHDAFMALTLEQKKLQALTQSNRPPEFPYVGPSPVFIVGFPRSGTTLMESILDSFSNVTLLSERSPMQSVSAQLFAREGPVGHLTETAYDFVELLRSDYWRRVRAMIDLGPGQTLVDKQSFNLVQGRAIHTLFPAAKFIFVQRHPLDVCLSCFTQVFSANPYMAHFSTLADAANLYATAIPVWQAAAQTLNLNVHTVRYEDLTENFEPTVRRLVAFLGLEWSNDVLVFHRHAAKRLINTPSYEQVTQDIYTTSRNRWKNYKTHLSPIMPILRPLIDAFGYDV